MILGRFRTAAAVSATATRWPPLPLSARTMSSDWHDLPDLTDKERLYVRRQVSVIMKPSFLRCEGYSSAQSILDRSSDSDRLLVDPSKPEIFNQMFPLYDVSTAACMKVIEKFCRGFEVPTERRAKRLFRSNLNSPLVTERTLAGLQVFGMIPADLTLSSYLPLLTFSEVAKVGKVCQVTEGTVKISRMNEYLAGESMRGSHVQNKIKITQKSLQALGFEPFSEKMLERVVNKFRRRKSIKYRDIDSYLSKEFMQWLCASADLTDEEAAKFCSNCVTDIQDIARNVFILENLMGVKDRKHLVRAAVSIDPLETLVTLNTYARLMETVLPSDSVAGDCSHLDLIVKPSSKFPPTYRYLYLKSIGFSCPEAVEILLQPKLKFRTSVMKSDFDRHTRLQSLVATETVPDPVPSPSEDVSKLLGYGHPLYLPVVKERWGRMSLDGLSANEKWHELTKNVTSVQQVKSLTGPNQRVSAGGMIQQRRGMATSSDDRRPPPQLKKPKRLGRKIYGYFKSPMRIIENRIQEDNIRRTLDPNFNPDEVIRGAKLAASALTKHISNNEIDELSGLLTQRELADLKRRIETEWTDQMRNVLRLEPEDFDKVVNDGYVRTDLQGMATYLDVRLFLDAIVDEPAPGYFVRIQMTLCRQYGEGAMHDWSVSYFNILAFE